MDPQLRAKLRRLFSQCLIEHQMLAPNDHILIALSGGKDSWALLGLFQDLQLRAPFVFSLSAAMVDGGFVNFSPEKIEKECFRRKVPFYLVQQNIFVLVKEKKEEGSAFCSLCSKFRRGVLYKTAKKIEATKIALGHHLNDALETLLLNLFYGGKMAALPPVLYSNQGNVPILRPLLYIQEKDLLTFVQDQEFPLMDPHCPIWKDHPQFESEDLKRKKIKGWVEQLAKENPQLYSHARASLRKLVPGRFCDPLFCQIEGCKSSE